MKSEKSEKSEKAEKAENTGRPGRASAERPARLPHALLAPELDGPLEFLRLLWAVAHGLESLSKQMTTRLGITGPQRLVVRMVGRFPSITSGQLAQLLHVHPSTLTGVLQRLERRGLVTRQRDGRDRRRALIGLTAEGRRFDVETPGTNEAAVAATLTQLDAAESASARRALSLLAVALDRAFAEAAKNAEITGKDAAAARPKPLEHAGQVHTGPGHRRRRAAK
jgi:DNA-binding MarR family transcriptional regulator